GAARCGRAITAPSRSCAASGWWGRPARASPCIPRPTTSSCWPGRCRAFATRCRLSMRPRDPFSSPRFGQIATFMLLPAADSPEGLDVALLGIPYDGGVSYRPGARFGPRAVREQSSLIRSWHPVLKVHPFERLRVADCGDIDVAPTSIEQTYQAIT